MDHYFNMKLLIIYLSLILSACGEDGLFQRHKYRLSNGSIIECANAISVECGLNFSDCDDDKIYKCQTNVERL